MTHFRYFAISAILVFAAALLWFVWPTRYRYDHLEGSTKVPVRIDRLTGRAEVLTGDGWKPLGHSEPMAQEDVPPSELARVAGQCRITAAGDGNDRITCDIYNGSTWKLDQITVHIDASGLSRDYKLHKFYGGAPLESTKFDADLGFPMDQAGQGDWVDQAPARTRTGKLDFIPAWNWRIVGARGVRE